MLSAGDLDRRITLQAPFADKNKFNEAVEGWSDVREVWASYEPLSDSEQRRALEVGAAMTARFCIRWSAEVRELSPTWRVQFDGLVFDIVGVKPIGRREGLEISAVTRTDRGT